MADLSRPDQDLAQGGGLEEMGLGDVQRANQIGAAASQSESERSQYNKQVSVGNSAGIGKLLGTAGTVAGFVYGGPVGAAMGGMAGNMIGGMMG